MSLRLLVPLFILCGASLLAQAPTRTSETHTSPLGFSYSLPNDWDVIDSQLSLPEVKRQQSQRASSDEEKKGIQCVQIALTARHGTPASVVVVVALPFARFGQQMTEKDLPRFAGNQEVVCCRRSSLWRLHAGYAQFLDRARHGNNDRPSPSEVHGRDCLQPAAERRRVLDEDRKS